MPKYQLSNAAEEDVEEIYIYSITEFGRKKAVSYVTSLEHCFELLADQPLMGKSIDSLRTGYFIHSHQQHNVCYTFQDGNLIVMRVLHKTQLPLRHL